MSCALHNDAMTFGVPVLSEDEVAKTKRLLGLSDPPESSGEAETCARTPVRRRNAPDPQLLLPPVTNRAREADEHWASRIRGLHGPEHMLGFRGLYLPAFRTGSRSVHSALAGLAV